MVQQAEIPLAAAAAAVGQEGHFILKMAISPLTIW